MEEHYKKYIQEAIKEGLRDGINFYVNGKIDRLHQLLTTHEMKEDKWQIDIKNHLERQDEKLEELRPFIESKNTIFNIRKFLLWGAAPIGIAYAIWQFFIEKIK